MSPISRGVRQTGLILSAASLVALSLLASAKSDEVFVKAILSNLPAPSSAAYSALYEAANRPAIETLDMTKAEVWSVPAGNWAAASKAARNAGVNLTKLDQAWNHALVPMVASEMPEGQKTLMRSAMKSKAAIAMTAMALPDPRLEEYALTRGMHDAGAPRPEIVIPISNEKSVTARRTSIAPVLNGYAWHGVVVETGEPVTILWWPPGKLTGSVTYRGHVYSVRGLGGGAHAIIEINPAMLPGEHAPLGFDLMKKMHLQEDPLAMHGDAGALMDKAGKPVSLAPAREPPLPPADRSDTKNLQDAGPAKEALIAPGPLDITRAPLPASETREQATIRLIVAYTKAAASHYGDIETDLIPLAIEEANESFRVSGITNVKLELAHAYETNYIEEGSHFDHVFRFAYKDDGYMDEVHELRAKYKADVGVLIVDDPHGCGLSAEVHARPERAFAVVHHECAANMYSLAHEIGHLIGARHDEALDDGKEPFPYGHGFVSGKAWRTMMAYKDSCGGCPRVPVWSSPMVKVRGVPAGDALSDNARVIAENAARIASFRSTLIKSSKN